VDAWLAEHDQRRISRELFEEALREVAARQHRRDRLFRHPFPGNVLRRVQEWADGNYDGDGPEVVTALVDANIVTSEYRSGADEIPLPWLEGPEPKHRLVIDIDHRVKVEESTTPGHFHLYIDVPMVWEAAVDILEALARGGVVEPGYVEASKARGYTAVRVPWVKKGDRNAVA